MIQDLARAIRRLRRRPASVAAVVVTLALGIGASVGMFSVLHGVVLRALPYPDDDRLVLPYVQAPNLATSRAGFTSAEAAEGLGDIPGFERTAYYGTNELPYTFAGANARRQLDVVRVSAGFFPVFAVPAETGRTLVAADFEQRRPVAVLSHAAWTELTGGDAGAVGRTLQFEEGAFEVVGVLPASFQEPPGGDLRLYVPFLESDLLIPGYRVARQISAVGRLAPGVSRAQALAALAARIDAVNTEHGTTTERGQRYGLVRLIDDLLGNLNTVLFGLFAVALLVLLIACSTAGSLVGIRFERRATELALRRALGAGSARLVKDAIYELALLAAAAAVGGVLVAQLVVLSLRPLAAASLPRAEGIAVDGATLLFAAAATAATVLLTGAASLSTLLKDPGSRLRAGVPQLVEGGRRPALLPVAAVGMAVVALAAALALSASLIRLRDIDPGIRTSNVVALSLSFVRRPAAEADQALDRVLAAVRATPGVADAAGMLFGVPTAAGMSKAHGRTAPGGESVFVGVQMASESYHRLLGIAIRRGRDIAETDVASGPRVAVINETLARALFPDTDPIGRTLYVAGNEIPFEIVGIAADRRNAGLRAPPDPEVVGSLRQWEAGAQMLLVRWAGKPPDDWAKLLEAKVNDVDARQPVGGGVALDDHLAAQTRALRLFAFATNCFAVLALVLCGLGVNAVIASVQQRREREMGLRMALGASPRQAGALVLVTAARIVGFGVVLAAVLAVPTFGWLRSQLFDIGPAGFWTLFAAAALVSAAAGLVAALLPARRAARVAPMQALRYE
ncbi:MAG TPA: ABC transporter permease [Gammaproteobacteria bacterium]|nr:ABC transporter permease [Gammaproteobacteria bacterium]